MPRLLDSLAHQTCRDFNWIVQDGASTDNTMTIVEHYRAHLPEILVHTEKDSGIYDAWNKAIECWQVRLGEWVLFLGADDILVDAYVLENVKNSIKNISTDVIFAAGDLVHFDYSKNIGKFVRLKDSYECFSKRDFKLPMPHSSLFTRREVITSTKFDTSFKVSGDYDFLLKTFNNPYQLHIMHVLVTQMSRGGISDSDDTLFMRFYESLRLYIRHRSLRGIIKCFDFLIYKPKIFIKIYLHKSCI
ncbi:MAG: glycosyltransferase [Desulfovibrio sp.]|nr:glycosyltransferase [Desulfovibrio sp.]